MDGCDVRLVDRVSFEGVDANMIPEVGGYRKMRTRTRAPIRQSNQIIRQPPTTLTRDPDARTTLLLPLLHRQRTTTQPSEVPRDNRTAFTSTGKRPVEIERPFCLHGHGSMVMQVTPQQSLYWESSTCRTTSGLSLGGCGVRLVDRESFEGGPREHGSQVKTKHRASKECRGI